MCWRDGEEALSGSLTIETCAQALYRRMVNLAYQLGWNSFQRQGVMCSLLLPLSTKGIYIIVCRQCCVYLAVWSRNPSAVLGVGASSRLALSWTGDRIRLSLHLGSFLSFPLGLADSCRMVLAPVIPEPLFLEPVGALSQRTPSPENLQGLFLSGRLVWGAS